MDDEMKIMRPRWLATATYVCTFIAAVIFIIFPSASMSQGLAITLSVIFHGFLLIGSMISMYGAYRKRSAFEAAGAPLIISAALVYAILLFAAAITGESRSPGAASGIGFLMLTISFGLGGRMVECLQLMKISTDVYDREHR